MFHQTIDFTPQPLTDVLHFQSFHFASEVTIGYDHGRNQSPKTQTLRLLDVWNHFFPPAQTRRLCDGCASVLDKFAPSFDYPFIKNQCF